MKRVNKKQTLKQLESEYLKINALKSKLLGEISRADKEHEILIKIKKELEEKSKVFDNRGLDFSNILDI